MTVSRTKIFSTESSGASILEVLLALAIVSMIAPFVYNQIARTTSQLRDMSMAKSVLALREPMLNFVRMNQDKWPDTAQIRLDDAELDTISELPTAGFIDKYYVRGATITDIYLAFDIGADELQTNRISKNLGDDSAVVGPDGVAYGRTWAVSAPDFLPGNLIYRITRDYSGEDRTKYLHRGTSGEDELNQMQRDLNMGGYNVFNVGGIDAQSAQIQNAESTFVDADEILAENVYFSSGANMDGGDVFIGDMRVSGDVTGFRTISADKLNGTTYTTSGHVITDRADVTRSVNVSGDFVIKSDTAKTISGFDGLNVSSVVAPFISTEEIMFYEDFGLTVSGELLMSTTSPVKLGNWIFPSTTPPRFSKMSLSRAEIKSAPTKGEFSDLFRSGWQMTEQNYIPTIQ